MILIKSVQTLQTKEKMFRRDSLTEELIATRVLTTTDKNQQKYKTINMKMNNKMKKKKTTIMNPNCFQNMFPN